MRLILATLILASSFSAMAATNVLKVTKTMHPENFINVEVNLDSNCKMISLGAGKGYLDFYYMMEGKRREEFSDSDNKRLKYSIQRSGDSTELRLKVDKLAKFFDDGIIRIESGKKSNGECGAWSTAEIQGSHVRLSEVKLFISFFQIAAVNFKGTTSDGSSFSKKVEN
jgi:hypothetical protein